MNKVATSSKVLSSDSCVIDSESSTLCESKNCAKQLFNASLF